MSVIFPPVSYAGATSASVGNIQIDIGDPSGEGTTNIYDTIKYMYQKTAGAAMASVIDDSIIGHILAIDGDVSDYNDNLHSLEALYNAIAGQVTAVNRVNGRFQIFEKAITSPANAGTTTVATITTQPCLIEEIVLHSDTASQGWLSSAAIHGGENSIITFLSATDATADNIDVVDEQVSWTGAVRLAAGKPIIIDLQGTGATTVDLTVTIGYRACADGGYLV